MAGGQGQREKGRKERRREERRQEESQQNEVEKEKPALGWKRIVHYLELDYGELVTYQKRATERAGPSKIAEAAPAPAQQNATAPDIDPHGAGEVEPQVESESEIDSEGESDEDDEFSSWWIRWAGTQADKRTQKAWCTYYQQSRFE